MLRHDKDAAWAKYMAYTRPAGTLTFLELLEQAGLDSPFSPDTLCGVAEEASAWLAEQNL